MKSKWLKKAMAAFLAVLMTVCALPIAAFVPETVETGEEFAVETQDFFANGKTSIEMNGVIYFINNDDEDKLYKYSQSSPIHELVLDKHITTLVESDIANNEIYLVEYIDGKTQLLKMNTLSNETEEVVHFQGVVTNICIRNNTIFFVDNNRILYYDNNQCKTLVDLDNVATVFFQDI